MNEAYQQLDANRDQQLSLDEVKERFEPSRHPDVKAGVKTVEEAKFEFYNLFTSLHSANKNFKNDRTVTLADFQSYHQFISTTFQHDIEFRNFMVGVWNMDISKENNKEIAGIPAPGKFMKNSHE